MDLCSNLFEEFMFAILWEICISWLVRLYFGEHGISSLGDLSEPSTSKDKIQEYRLDLTNYLYS